MWEETEESQGIYLFSSQQRPAWKMTTQYKTKEKKKKKDSIQIDYIMLIFIHIPVLLREARW